MNRLSYRTIQPLALTVRIVVALAGFMALALIGEVAADSARPAISVREPWAVATLGHSRPAAAYLTLINRGQKLTTLVDARSSATKLAEISRYVEDGKLMRIQMVDRIDIAPGSSITLSPDGWFIKLADYWTFFSEGDKIPLTLIFEDGTELSLAVPVFAAGTSNPYGR